MIAINQLKLAIMNLFDKTFAAEYINKLLKKHRIKVVSWSTASCGWAMVKERRIKIPKPTNIDRFAVCLHEVFHVIGRKGSKSFEKEFYCDMYAKGILLELGYDVEEWDKRTKWHVLSRIAMAHNRGLNHAKINPEIRGFFAEIDFNAWVGKKVFVGYKYRQSSNPSDIELTDTMSKDEIEQELSKRGLTLTKSDRDDSSYSKWIVVVNGARLEYDNLQRVAIAFGMTQL